MRYFGTMFLMLVMTFLLGLPAKALELYAIGTGNAFVPGPEPTTAARPVIPESILYRINPETGEPSEIGPITGYTRCKALDIHPFTEEFCRMYES